MRLKNRTDKINSIELTFECEKCKKHFRVSKNDVAESTLQRKEFLGKNGDSIFLMYFDCPFCKNRIYVQIDDAKSINMLKELTRLFVKLSVKKRKGKEIPKSQSDKLKKMQNDLSNYRNKLMSLYNDRIIHDDDNDTDFVLKLTICK